MRSTAFTLTPVIALVLALTAVAPAHPGIGVVLDSKGNAYYSDLKQVWRISAGGEKNVAVANVHTHELWIDSLDNLYGEHLWYEGDATGKWGHRVWKRSPGGAVTDVIPPREGFRDDSDDFHFVRDRAGRFFWMEGDSLIRVRSPGGPPADLIRARSNRAGWLTASAGGRLFFVDGDDLVEVDGNRRSEAFTVIARGITTDDNGRALQFGRHAVGGIFADPSGNVFITVPGRGCVKKAAPDGTLTVVDRSVSPWKPSGIAAGPDGDLWILEYSPSNDVRLRHVRPGGATRTY